MRAAWFDRRRGARTLLQRLRAAGITFISSAWKNIDGRLATSARFVETGLRHLQRRMGVILGIHLLLRSHQILGVRWWMPTSKIPRACSYRGIPRGGIRYTTMAAVREAYTPRAALVVARIVGTQCPLALFVTCDWAGAGANPEQDRAQPDQALHLGGVRQAAGERPGVLPPRVAAQLRTLEREMKEVVRRHSGSKGEARGAPPRASGPS